MEEEGEDVDDESFGAGGKQGATSTVSFSFPF